MTRICINDGSRHIHHTGYGNLARAIITALDARPNIEVGLRYRDAEVPDTVSDKEILDRIPIWDRYAYEEFDCVLQVTHPQKIREGRPALFYTQNALSKLIPEWVTELEDADGLIVPSEFDARVFREHFDNVHVCHQFTDDRLFRNRGRYRDEGPDRFSFLFVGAYGYRKGVDLLLDAFPKAFDSGQEVNLTLHCFVGLEREAINDLIQFSRELPDNITFSVYSGSVPPKWMARIYEQHDCVVSFSRGEGWCMPLHEALLTEKPIIAPNSTAMGECLPDEGCIKVETRPRLISDITDPFGASMKSRYGIPGNEMYEVDPDAAIQALREMYDNYDTYAAAAKAGRMFVATTYSKKSLGIKLVDIVHAVMGSTVTE